MIETNVISTASSTHLSYTRNKWNTTSKAMSSVSGLASGKMENGLVWDKISEWWCSEREVNHEDHYWTDEEREQAQIWRQGSPLGRNRWLGKHDVHFAKTGWNWSENYFNDKSFYQLARNPSRCLTRPSDFLVCQTAYQKGQIAVCRTLVKYNFRNPCHQSSRKPLHLGNDCSWFDIEIL